MKVIRQTFILVLVLSAITNCAVSQETLVEIKEKRFSLSFFDSEDCFGQDISVSLPYFYCTSCSQDKQVIFDSLNQKISLIGNEVFSQVADLQEINPISNDGDPFLNCGNESPEIYEITYEICKNVANCLSFTIVTNWSAGGIGTGRSSDVRYFTIDTTSGLIEADSLFTKFGLILYYQTLNNKYIKEAQDSICLDKLCEIDSCISIVEPCETLKYMGFKIKESQIIASVCYYNNWFYEYQLNFEDFKEYIKPRYYKLFD